ncbi:MAG TPA: anthrone oxygenase family protein [Candidatus Angelobacter sp.]|nr:anthrone oxygenase family protein [Candidatus Angelobacter sp.]
MLKSLHSVLIFAAAIGCGIVGGIFYAFSSFVMTALAKLPAGQGVAAMNSISVAVLNPSFMTVFAGTGIVCLALSVQSIYLWSQPGSKLALAASLVYLVGCFGVTAVLNVPLNDRLASLGDTAEAAAYWPHYLAAWNLWNHVRSVAGVSSAALFIWAFRQR